MDGLAPEAQRSLALITLRGPLRGAPRRHAWTPPAFAAAGESFLANGSREEDWLDGDAHHMKLNPTAPIT